MDCSCVCTIDSFFICECPFRYMSFACDFTCDLQLTQSRMEYDPIKTSVQYLQDVVSHN